MDKSLQSFWAEVLEILQDQLSRPTFETWIKTAIAERLDDRALILRTPTPFARNWLQKYYIKAIAQATESVLGRPVEVEIIATREEDAPGAIDESVSVFRLIDGRDPGDSALPTAGDPGAIRGESGIESRPVERSIHVFAICGGGE